MKISKVTPGSNLQWESSRFILPELRERILQHNKEQNRNIKPVFDDQRIEEISRVIAESIYNDLGVTIVVFGEYEHSIVQGRIDKVDTQLKQIKVVHNDEEYEWVKLNDIVDIYIL